MSKPVLGWWFSADRTLPNDDGRRIQVGRTLVHRGEVVPCRSGLHFSARAIDALAYASGNLCWRVEGGGEVAPHGDPIDKYACSRRKHLWMVEAEPVLRRFERWCALRIVHLWDAPDVMVRYLRTGDDTLRDAALNAAWNTARVTARAAAWATSRNAAWATSRNAAWNTARVTAMDAARNITVDAAWSDSWAAQNRAAAWRAARVAQNRALERMLNQAHEGTLDYDRPLPMPRRNR